MESGWLLWSSLEILDDEFSATVRLLKNDFLDYKLEAEFENGHKEVTPIEHLPFEEEDVKTKFKQFLVFEVDAYNNLRLDL